MDVEFLPTDNPTQSRSFQSECNAVKLTLDNEMVAVGTYVDNEPTGSSRTAALIIKAEYNDGGAVT